MHSGDYCNLLKSNKPITANENATIILAEILFQASQIEKDFSDCSFENLDIEQPELLQLAA